MVAILIMVLICFYERTVAQDTLIVIFDRENFIQGDSIEMEIYTEPYQANRFAQTLHLWIDNIETGQRWKYRYPFIKGRINVGLKIAGGIPTGTYAFNFLLQNQFLAINGKILSKEKNDSSINYLARANGKIPVIDDVVLQPGGVFRVTNFFFTDSALFSFSPAQPKKRNELQIGIETPIDSLFFPAATTAGFITIGRLGNIDTALKQKTAYSFDLSDKRLLREVVVKTKAKTPMDEYKEKYVSGLFGGEDATTVNFLDNDEASSFPDLFSYLVFKIPGLIQLINPENGQPYLAYRNKKVDIYVDEFLDTDFWITGINIQNVAMVKFYHQSLRVGMGLSDRETDGSIAIYTKRPGDRRGNKLSNYTFLIKGYSSMSGEWK